MTNGLTQIRQRLLQPPQLPQARPTLNERAAHLGLLRIGAIVAIAIAIAVVARSQRTERDGQVLDCALVLACGLTSQAAREVHARELRRRRRSALHQQAVVVVKQLLVWSRAD